MLILTLECGCVCRFGFGFDLRIAAVFAWFEWLYGCFSCVEDLVWICCYFWCWSTLSVNSVWPCFYLLFHSLSYLHCYHCRYISLLVLVLIWFSFRILVLFIIGSKYIFYWNSEIPLGVLLLFFMDIWNMEFGNLNWNIVDCPLGTILCYNII